MNLIPREIDKLLIAQVGYLAQRRLARGVQLNQVEATGLIAMQLHESDAFFMVDDDLRYNHDHREVPGGPCLFAFFTASIPSNRLVKLIRSGNHTVADLQSAGRTLLGRRHVQPAVVTGLSELMVEGTFPTGTYLVTVHEPICTDGGDLEKALWGSFLPIPSQDLFPLPDPGVYAPEKQPGAIIALKENSKMVSHPTRKRIRLRVTSKGDRPIQVGSHYHFIETNSQLEFDRIQAYGYCLDIPAGTSVRFEPGQSRQVTLRELGGNRIIRGGNNIASGRLDISRVEEITQRLQQAGFAHVSEPTADSTNLQPCTQTREQYITMFGPTTGDLVRLGATDLWVRVEKDFTNVGDECKFGGGKTLREGMGQSSGKDDTSMLDTVVTNALIIDWSGIYKADIGIKHGKIVGIGKAGNPDTMDQVEQNMTVGSGTDVIAAEGMIVTAGGIDAHVHFICPQQAAESLDSGITTVLGGGTGPSAGSCATTCTPGKQHISNMLQAVDALPLNVGLTGKGNDSTVTSLEEQIVAGACGLKLHEDWGTTPAAIDACLKVCDSLDVQCLIHTDTLNESGFVESTLAAIDGRTIHTYHTEGAGGGHAPDIIAVVSHPNVIPSSTNPTRPYTRDTLDEHLDMLMVCHHLSRAIPEDVAFAESRIRAETIGAEDVLHDSGAISIMSSDAQAMGRCGEVVLRTWHTAHTNKVQRGFLPEDTDTGADNTRVKRYVSKYTINPAIAQGMSHVLGSVEVGKLADLVIWRPRDFGTKPRTVVKSGIIAAAMMGDANASIPTVEPMVMRPQFGPHVPSSNITFVSQASLGGSIKEKLGLRNRVEAVRNCRNIGKKDMKWNDTLPQIKVDPERYTVEADGELLQSKPATQLPLTQGYFLF